MLCVIRFIFRVVLPERNELSKKKSNKNPKQTTITTGEREGEREKKRERERWGKEVVGRRERRYR